MSLAGGLFQPILGIVADHGPQGAFIVLAAIPLIAITFALALKEPAASTSDSQAHEPT